METFFTFLKKGLVATIFVIFAFVAVYIPQPFNPTHEVDAGGMTGGATLPMQIVQNGSALAGNVQATLSAGFNSATSFATGSLWVKENLLDGIGWAIAKKIVSSMAQSLINWINSGFQGSPSFITDLKGFLLNVADQAIGEYIADLGGIGSFICSPFRLDVQISVQLQYNQARAEQPASSCTLTGVVNNLQNFMDGTFAQANGSGGINGGWADWFDITQQPEVYTPYGAVLSAQAGARAKLINAQGEEIKLLDFGDGFLSGKLCQAVQGANSPRDNCVITKPGKIIEEALSFNLDSGRQSLITADEINEIIAALLGQLANTALTGAAGLLGLSGGTGYTSGNYNSGSYLNQMVADQTTLTTPTASSSPQQQIQNALNVQNSYSSLATAYVPNFQNYINNSNNSPAKINNANQQLALAQSVVTNTSINIPLLTQMSIDMSLAIANNDTTQQNIVMTQYGNLTNLYVQQDITNSQLAWTAALQ